MNLAGRNFLFISLILACVIVYGSLYPFQFHPHPGAGALQDLLDTWRKRPGFGDFLSNVLLYMPLGLFCFLATSRNMAMPWRICLAILCGFALSLAMELTQYYDADRDTEASDLYSNTLGTLAGAILALLNPAWLWGKSFQPKIAARIPALLVAAWVAYKLYPFVPVIDLHKYWHALEPLLKDRRIAGADLFRHFVTWTLCATAVRGAVNGRAALWYLALLVFVLAAKIFVVGGVLSNAEIAGAGLALLVLLAAGRHPRVLTRASAALLAVYIVQSRLMPFQWLAVPRAFGWIPFLSLMQGSISIDVLSFLEKFFLYGGLIWLLRECGVRFRHGSVAVAILLFGTSWAERYLPGRSAEITDAILALLIGAGFALLAPAKDAAPGTRSI